MNARQTVSTFMLLASTLFLTGCLFGGHSDVRREGNYVSSNTLSQIEPGKTTSAWVRAVIGEPNEKNRLGDHEEIWKYSYSETKDSGGYILFIFETDDKKVTRNNIYVQFKDDIVSQRWQD